MCSVFSFVGISWFWLFPNAISLPVLVCAQVRYPEVVRVVIWSLVFSGRVILVGVRVVPGVVICPLLVSPQQYSPFVVAAQVWAAPVVRAVISPLPLSTGVGLAACWLGLPVACPVLFFPQQYTVSLVAAQVVAREVARWVIGLFSSSVILWLLTLLSGVPSCPCSFSPLQVMPLPSLPVRQV